MCSECELPLSREIANNSLACEESVDLCPVHDEIDPLGIAALHALARAELVLVVLDGWRVEVDCLPLKPRTVARLCRLCDVGGGVGREEASFATGDAQRAWEEDEEKEEAA